MPLLARPKFFIRGVLRIAWRVPSIELYLVLRGELTSLKVMRRRRKYIKIPPPLHQVPRDSSSQAQRIHSRKWYRQHFLGWKNNFICVYFIFRWKCLVKICISFHDDYYSCLNLKPEKLQQHHHFLYTEDPEVLKPAFSLTCLTFVPYSYNFPIFLIVFSILRKSGKGPIILWSRFGMLGPPMGPCNYNSVFPHTSKSYINWISNFNRGSKLCTTVEDLCCQLVCQFISGISLEHFLDFSAPADLDQLGILFGLCPLIIVLEIPFLPRGCCLCLLKRNIP